MGFHSLDAHIRRRLRAVLLKQWKRKRFIVRNLITLKVCQFAVSWGQLKAFFAGSWGHPFAA
jgi:ABC-type taurine transport system ATPase subunit